MFLKKVVSIIIAFLVAISAFAQNNLLQEGDNHFDNGEYAQAVSKYNEAFKASSGKDRQIADIKRTRAKYCQEHLRLADTEYSQKHYSKAKTEYQNVLDSNPKDSYARSQIEKCNNNGAFVAALTVSREVVNISKDGGTETITVISNTDWYLSSVASSMFTVARSGNSLTIKCNSNHSGSLRSDYFYVNTKDDAEHIKITVKQAGNPASNTSSQQSNSIRLSVSKTDITTTAESSTTVIDVNTNASDYSVILLPSWCYVKAKYPTWFSIGCYPNMQSKDRSDYFKVTVGGKDVKINITQKGKINSSYSANSNATSETYLKVSKLPQSLGAQRGSYIIDVKTNARDYTISSLPSWCRVRSKRTNSFCLDYDENHGEYRTDWFLISAGGKSIKVYISQNGVSPRQNYSLPNKKTDKVLRFGVGILGEINNDNIKTIGSGVGVSFRIGKYSSLLNVVISPRYQRSFVSISDKDLSYDKLFLPLSLNINVVRGNSASWYFGGGYELALELYDDGYTEELGTYFINSGINWRHSSLRLFCKPQPNILGQTTAPIIGIGFTYYL